MSNNQTSVNQTGVEELFDYNVELVLHVTYGMLCTIAVCVNIIVMYLYNTRKIQQSNFNLCLAHLSGMNMAQSIGILPFVYVNISELNKQSQYIDSLKCSVTDGMCGYFAFAFGCGFCISFMSLSRLAIIRKPLSLPKQKYYVKKVLIGFWIFGILGLIPNIFSWKLDNYHGFCVRVHLISPTLGFIYQMILSLLGLVLPILAESVSYIMIICQLYKAKCKTVDHSSIKFRKQITKLLGILICIHIFCWVPFGVYWILSSFGFYGNDIAAEYKKSRIIQFVMIPCVFAGVLNPICYTLTGKEFREALKKTFPTVSVKRIKLRKRSVRLHEWKNNKTMHSSTQSIHQVTVI